MSPLSNSWPIRDESVGPLTEDDQAHASDYRPDAGQHMTDRQHEQWMSGQ